MSEDLGQSNWADLGRVNGITAASLVLWLGSQYQLPFKSNEDARAIVNVQKLISHLNVNKTKVIKLVCWVDDWMFGLENLATPAGLEEVVNVDCCPSIRVGMFVLDGGLL